MQQRETHQSSKCSVVISLSSDLFAAHDLRCVYFAISFIGDPRHYRSFKMRRSYHCRRDRYFCIDYLCFAPTTCVLHHGTPAQQVIPPGTKTAHASFAITEFYLRINSIEGTGKGDGLSYMIEPTDPCHGALDPHSKARMRNGAVPAQVEVPLESLER